MLTESLKEKSSEPEFPKSEERNTELRRDLSLLLMTRESSLLELLEIFQELILSMFKDLILRLWLQEVNLVDLPSILRLPWLSLLNSSDHKMDLERRETIDSKEKLFLTQILTLSSTLTLFKAF